MKLDEQERELFEAFSEAELREIDLAPLDLGQAEHEAVIEDEEYQFEAANDPAPMAAPIQTLTPRQIKTGFSWTAFAGGLTAIVWIGGAIGGPISYFGVDAVMAMDPAMQAGLIALAFGPAILFWLGGAAAGEAFKARRLATELTRMAHDSLLPLEAGESQAQRLSNTVKAEIEALNDAVAGALSRLSEFEAVAQKHAVLFDNAVAATRENADYLAGNLARERDALVELNGELRGQSDTMAHSIGRQVRLMREASKLVKNELGAAEGALQSHLVTFSASAQTLAERTAEIHVAADSTHSAVASLNGTMSTVLEGLGQATQLTDAARQSTEQAALVANETASAVRETTQRAVTEAKRAAQAIRAETAAMQDAAIETLSRLEQAAQAARAASEESQAAADRHAASIEKRLTSLAATAAARPKAPVAPVVAPRPVQAAPRVAVKAAPAPAPTPAMDDAFEQDGLYAAAAAAVSRTTARPSAVSSGRAQAETLNVQAERKQAGFKGFGGWNNLFPNHRDEEAPQAANAPQHDDAFDLVDFDAPRAPSDASLKNDAINLVLDAGADFDDLQAADLERIAQRSRHGAAARRQAVVDAAPGAVNRVVRHLKRDEQAKQAAAAFRARPDLAKSEKKGEHSDLVRSYLLIDAALG